MPSTTPASLPGSLCQQYQQQRDQFVARGVANGPPIFARRARGAEVEDLDGNAFLDFAGGIGTLNVGHAHPAVVEAVKQQADAFLHTCFNIVMYPGYIDLARALVQRVPGEWPKKVMLQSTGSEAVENAVKIARRATGRQAIVAFEGAFHGRTNMALALTAKAPAYKTGFGPLASEVYRAPFPVVYRSGADEDTVVRQAYERFVRMIETEIGANQVAAVIIEPLQGEGGFHPVPAPFMRQLREFCTRHGIVLIADEIQSGFCRTGRWFATEHSGVAADLYTLAKSMGGGMPIAAVVGRADLMDAPKWAAWAAPTPATRWPARRRWRPSTSWSAMTTWAVPRPWASGWPSASRPGGATSPSWVMRAAWAPCAPWRS
ncbi:4-aminobutyrate aminotransferase [Bordetella trematum]|nr:4-aminobutyrate aminotransferase [Bordetella trematum]